MALLWRNLNLRSNGPPRMYVLSSEDSVLGLTIWTPSATGVKSPDEWREQQKQDRIVEEVDFAVIRRTQRRSPFPRDRSPGDRCKSLSWESRDTLRRRWNCCLEVRRWKVEKRVFGKNRPASKDCWSSLQRYASLSTLNWVSSQVCCMCCFSKEVHAMKEECVISMMTVLWRMFHTD